MDPIVRFVRNNSEELRTGDHTLRSIFEIIFRNEENIMAETSSALRIVEHSYGAVKKRVVRAAGAIECRGEFIGLWGENSVEWIAAFWAILMSGNKPCLINLMQPTEFSDSILKTLGANKVIVTDAGKTPALSAALIPFAELEERGCELPADTVFGNEIALSTSGTTLHEKICVYTGREITEQILNCDRIIDKNPDIKEFYHGRLKMLMFLPLYHIFGLEAAYLWFAFGNITFVFLPSLSPDAILHTIRRHEVTHIFAVPLLWHTVEKAVNREVKAKGEKTWEKFQKGLRLSEKLQSTSPRLGRKLAAKLLKEVRSEVFGDSVLFCISGGSYIRSSALRLVNCLGYPLYNGYGMSELGITSVELSRNIKDRLKGSIGKPFDSIEYRIGEGGSLLVRGESVCRRVIVDGVEQPSGEWFDTGDIMRMDKDGRYYAEGRRSDVVFSDNGEKLNPDLAERELDLTNALGFTVTGDENNERLILIVRIARTLADPQREKLKAQLEEGLASLPPAYRISRVYYTYDPLMEEGGIKVSREFVRLAVREGRIKLFTSLDEAKASLGSVDTEIASILRGIFAEVLDVPPESIDPDAHFLFDLGGSSLDYFTLIGEIDKRFEIKLPFGDGDLAYSLAEFTKKVGEMLEKL